ncbi:MAG: hypothetical protein K9N46_05515 [Candidatus Marinimicrobia bacterium]|nr:hypothetical protein [Candidatus Neomarinimicrobiota bacterium]MCF7880181.1 hypothetical protein [Candidatus Neomarinimicrobiota bacterium]
MAFDELSEKSKRLLIEVIELLQSGKYEFEIKFFHSVGLKRDKYPEGQYRAVLVNRTEEKTKNLTGFEPQNLDQLSEHDYIDRKHSSGSIYFKLNTRAFEEYALFKIKQFKSCKNFSELRSKITESQQAILDYLFENYGEKKRGVLTRVVHSRYGKPVVRSALEPIGRSVVQESDERNESKYRLTYLGMLLSSRGKKYLELLSQYLTFVLEIYYEEPEREKINSDEIQNALGITDDELNNFELVLGESDFSGSSRGTDGKGNWYVTFPREVDDLPSIKDFSSYILDNAFSHFELGIPLGPESSQMISLSAELYDTILNGDTSRSWNMYFYSFIDEGRLAELRAIQSDEFDLKKVIRLCEEMIVCHQKQCYLALAMLTRSLLDHVPPIFGYKKFTEVANNFSGSGKSFRKSMQHLEKSSRNIADRHLHEPIRKKENLPNKTQVNFSNDLDVLLEEIVRILG